LLLFFILFYFILFIIILLEFKPDEVISNLQTLRQEIEAIVLKFAAVSEDKNQLLQLVVEAVGCWANLLEITEKIKTRLAAEDIQNELQDLISRKKRLGKVGITHPPLKQCLRLPLTPSLDVFPSCLLSV